MPTLVTPQRDLLIDMVQPVDLLNPLGQGLVAAYPMFGGTTGGPRLMDMVDPGPNGLHGSLTNMDKNNWGPSGDNRFVSALDFNGSDEFVGGMGGGGTVLDIPGNLTLLAWVKMNGDYTTTQGIISNLTSGGVAGNYQIEFGRTDNEFSFLQSGSTVDAVSSVALADDNWHQIGVTRSGSTGDWDISWFFDGEFDETDNTAANPAAAATATTSIGRPGEFDGQYFNGKIANVLIYNRALSPNEIQHLFQSPFAPFQRRMFLPVSAPAAAVAGNPWYYYAQQGAM